MPFLPPNQQRQSIEGRRRRKTSRKIAMYHVCSGMTDLHKIWHDDAELVSQARWTAIRHLQFFKL